MKVWNDDSYFKHTLLNHIVHSTIFTHSMYVVHKVKDGIVDRFTEKVVKRPSVDANYPDILLNVHVYEDKLTISSIS